jgi:hypothetical protein
MAGTLAILRLDVPPDGYPTGGPCEVLSAVAT